MTSNKSVIFKKIPKGWPVEGQDLVLETRSVDLTQAPAEGHILVRNHYVSFDPYQRGRLRPAHIKSYVPAYDLDAAISNSGVCTVVKSSAEGFKEGDVVIAYTGTEEYSTVNVKSSQARVLKNPHNLDPKVYLGPLGMPGLTAWSSLYEIGQPKKGETLFVSSASGAVGQIVGQLAKKEGCRVIGSVGDDKKLEFITKELGFDGGFNYKKETPLDALKRLCPDGLDIYYDNVGGEQLESAIEVMNTHGRIVVSGMISQYNVSNDDRWPIRNLISVVPKRLKIQGFIVSDFAPKYFADHQEKLAGWIADGSVKTLLSVTDGIDNAIGGFLGMLKGENFGKAVLKIKALGDESTYAGTTKTSRL